MISLSSDPHLTWAHQAGHHNAAAELWRKCLFPSDAERLVESVSKSTPPADAATPPYHQRHPENCQLPQSAGEGFLRSLPRDPFLGLTIHGYMFREVIRCGANATVYNVFKDGKVFAAKVSHPRNRDPMEVSKAWTTEFNIIGQVQHKNIIKAYELFEHKGRHVMILEYVGGSNLAEFIARKCQARRQGAMKKVMKQVVTCLEHLHSHDVVHGDITPDHILIGQGGKVKVIDFGDAIRLGTGSYNPQSKTRNVEDKIMKSFDMWMFGASVYESLTGKPPQFIAQDHSQLDVSGLDIPDRKLVSLLKKCLDLNPLDRITAKLALKNDYFKRFFY
ncbi:uncharacterized protein [Haliotis cracherodii]|uniref:uncharacterized protein n=1 Tax=Haliotis cracherodii TaxID=6455 RepID=UPI0039EC4005